MTTLTKKALTEVCGPVRRAAERVATSYCTGEKVHPADLALMTATCEGFEVQARITRRVRPCNGRFPYHAFEIEYSLAHPEHGPIVGWWSPASEMTHQALLALRKRGLI